MSGPINRTSLELYRDCLRLVKHLAPGGSAKGVALRNTLRQQFRASQNETNETTIAAKKADAVRALSNYMLFQSAQTDEKLKAAMKKSDSKPERKETGGGGSTDLGDNDDGSGSQKS